MQASSVTLIKREALEATIGLTVAKEIDFDLGLDEAIRILRVDALVMLNPGVTIAWAEAQLSLDPEDDDMSWDADDRFAYMYAKHSISGDNWAMGEFGARQSFDYSQINLITCRNLGMILEASGATHAYRVTIFYERFKPSAQDLNQLILHRR